ncbi:MAG TPA: PP2C family serine/threonine-protein phosphatase [Fimbriimonadaceae bacterium]|nr:PP2C family serine/threonine-protein phosphatase [Fimbriimonadaceae bacterium]
MSWTYAYAFHAGDGHKKCADICVCEAIGDTIIAAVSDGAGSAENAHAGATIACQCFAEMGIQLLSGTMEPSCLVEAIRERLPDGSPDSYACTLVGIVADPHGALVLQVGDGAAVYRAAGAGEGTFQVAIWPEETEFLNHTFFVTAPDATEHLLVTRIAEPVGAFALFTDGLQHLVIDSRSKSPHQPFFTTVFKPLSEEADHDVKASWWLERQLASDHVTKRTDDDTSIVIARRAGC